MHSLYCVCCGRPFQRASRRGPAPLYCSKDCRRQMDVRRRAWVAMRAAMGPAVAPPPESWWPAGAVVAPTVGEHRFDRAA